MDNSPEFLNALHYAATRAAKTGGGVEVLAIITPQDQTHWLGVAEKMREEARETIEENFKIYIQESFNAEQYTFKIFSKLFTLVVY